MADYDVASPERAAQLQAKYGGTSEEWAHARKVTDQQDAERVKRVFGDKKPFPIEYSE